MKMSGAEIIVNTLISHGVDEVFGYPGGSVLHLYDALYQNREHIRHYITCHEQGAAHAADGYARSTGKTGVVIATSGPGATNLVTGLATAYMDSTPVVAITGNVPLPLIGKDSFQEVDIAGITMPITKHNFIVKDIAHLEEIICEAFLIARSGRPGPVLVDVPKDIQTARFEFKGGTPRKVKPVPPPEFDKLAAAAEIIKKAKRPYIYAGGGVVIGGAYEELLKFAELIDAPVGLSIMGLTAIDSVNPRCLGMTGMHGSFAASKALAECDLIIGAGVRFSDRATGNKAKYRENKSIVHIDIDPAEIGKNVAFEASVVGDVKAVLQRLCGLMPPQEHSDWMNQIERYRREGEVVRRDNRDFSPKAIISAVRRHTDSDTVIATDVGQHQMWTAQYYQFSSPRTFITSGGLGTMGFGVGAAIGAAVGRGMKRTVLFTGDGSFHMNLNEVATAVMHNIPIVIVVMNNGVLGMVRQWQSLFFEKRFSETTLNHVTDFVKLAESFGAKGYRAADMQSLEAALSAAFSENAPAVIDCVIDMDEMVLPMIPPNGSVDDMLTT
ncbi:MAG: biosynthetic-type acetolactate synthase large subunit [Oscillospiraceae bacterium]|jgi:acetolactate synthase-1/2/3 large subunit|nr:biosynthetic-type acetolactate synthase large subunit [Oscillospiraceae bacterium]